ncbi:MAG: hypothetical protein ACTTJM_07520 [Bergeyella cardium]|uniref:hypothetical protein n=1 Tax=Bergeyella cardium TaxID=1585976 RepID=UPI000EA3AA96|nr:hypothetical protein [Bergeyella cardium]
MKRINHIISIFAIGIIFLSSCSKKLDKVSDLDILRSNTNTKSYPAVQMDSAQAINSITKQKVQEIIDLSALYLEGNQDTQIDSAIFKQMQAYFYQPDSLTFKPLFKELQDHRVKSAKVNHLEVFKDIQDTDTLDMAKFSVEYFDRNNRRIGEFNRSAQYILVTPNKESKEFKFFFLKFYQDLLPKNDSIPEGETR